MTQFTTRWGPSLSPQDPSYDIFNVDYNWVPEFGRAGHLLPMDDVLAAPETKGDDFLPRALDVARWEDTLYGIPQTVHPHILWYRKDLFEEAGLEPPATMEDWRAIVEQFQGTEVEGQEIYGWAAQAARGFGNVHTWLTFLYSFGGDAFNYETMEPTLTTPEATEGTQFWADMMKFTPPGHQRLHVRRGDKRRGRGPDCHLPAVVVGRLCGGRPGDVKNGRPLGVHQGAGWDRERSSSGRVGDRGLEVQPAPGRGNQVHPVAGEPGE